MSRGALAGLLLVTVVLAGCWDFRDLDQRAFAVMLGLDRADQGGYRVSAQIAVGTPHGRPQQPVAPYRILVGEGPGIQEALQVIRGDLYRELDLSLVGTVVIGAELAREGLHRLDWVVRALSLPPTALLVVSRDTAEAVVRAESPAMVVPALYLEQGLSGVFSRHPAALPVRLWKFYYRLLPSPLEDEYLAAVTSQNYGINYAGVAVLADGRLTGWLEKPEAEIFAVLRAGRIAGHLISGQVPGHPGARATLPAMGGRAAYWTELRGNTPVLRVRLRTSGALGELVGFSLQSPADQLLVQRGLAAAEENRVRQMISRLQALGADPLGFGELLRRRRPDHPAVRDAEGWRAAYARAEVRVDVDITVISPGFIK